MLTSFGAKNFKCLEDVELARISPIHVIIGENDAGKTSLLQAIHSLFATTACPLKSAFSVVDGVPSAFRLDDPSSPISFHASFLDEEASNASANYELVLSLPSAGNPQVMSEKLLVRDGAVNSWTSLPVVDNTLTNASAARRRNRPESSADDAMATSLAALLNSTTNCQFYSLNPKRMASVAPLSAHRRFRMDWDGFGLPTLLDDLLGFDFKLFQEAQSRFREFFPAYRAVHLIQEETTVNHVAAGKRNGSKRATGKGILIEASDGSMIPARAASDGVILFLGFLALACLPKPPSLLLIEEPENGIHPSRLRQVARLLRKLVEECGPSRPQVILTTHSPYLLDEFFPEEVTFMLRDKKGKVRARSMRDAPHIDDRMGGEFGLGEIWYNLSAEEIFQDA